MIGAVIRPHRHRAEPEVPVELRRNGRRFLRCGNALRPTRAVRPAVDLANVSDSPAADPLAHPPHVRARVPCVAHLCSDAGLAGDFHQPADFRNVVGQRHLGVDVLALPHGCGGDHRVRVVGRGHDDGVDALFLVQHPTIVFVAGGIRVSLESDGSHSRVDVA